MCELEVYEYYTNSGLPWITDETDQLINEYVELGWDINKIGKVHKRTPGGVAYKLKMLGIVYPASACRGYNIYKESKLYFEIVKTAKEETEQKKRRRKDRELAREDEMHRAAERAARRVVEEEFSRMAMDRMMNPVQTNDAKTTSDIDCLKQEIIGLKSDIGQVKRSVNTMQLEIKNVCHQVEMVLNMMKMIYEFETDAAT